MKWSYLVSKILLFYFTCLYVFHHIYIQIKLSSDRSAWAVAERYPLPKRRLYRTAFERARQHPPETGDTNHRRFKRRLLHEASYCVFSSRQKHSSEARVSEARHSGGAVLPMFGFCLLGLGPWCFPLQVLMVWYLGQFLLSRLTPGTPCSGRARTAWSFRTGGMRFLWPLLLIGGAMCHRY